MIIGTYGYVSLIVKIILLSLTLVLSILSAAETLPFKFQFKFIHLSFNSILQLRMPFRVISKSCLDILMVQQLLPVLEFNLH